MVKLRVALALVLTYGCGEPSSPSPNDAASDVDAVACAADCVEDRWWLSMSSDCALFCSGTPYPECNESDCTIGDARRFGGTDVETLTPLMYSETARSYQLLGGVMNDPYTIDGSCALSVDGQPPMEFTCSADELTFATGTLRAASAPQTIALDEALASGPGRYQY